MKKLRLKMQEQNNYEILTRQQLKNVVGGVIPQQTNNCAVYLPSGTGTGTPGNPTHWGGTDGIPYSSMNHSPVADTFYGVSSADAQAQAVGAGAHWCCDSCGTASWYHPSLP